MGLRFDPMGGGQFKQALNAIIEAEKQPIKTLEARKKLEQDRLKLFGEFKGKYSALQGTVATLVGSKQFKEIKAELGDGKDLMEVTLDKTKAQMGSWELEIKELAQRASMVSNGFSSADEKVLGMGYINLQLEDGSTRDVYVTQDESSLNGIAMKINNSPDSVVKATVVQDMADPERPYRLILTAKKSGEENNISFPQLYFVDGEEEFYIDSDKGSQNALVKINGFDTQLASNQLGDFMNGVGINLKQAKPGQKFTLSIESDNKKITEKVKKMIEDTNGVLDFINKQNQVDEKTDTKTTFAGDTGLQNIEFRLRNLLHEGFPVHMEDEDSFRVVDLNQLGITFDKSGKINFQEEKFVKEMEKDFDAIADVISGEKGFASQMKSVLDGYGAAGVGIVSTREKGIKDRISSIDKNIENKQRLLEQKTKTLTDQFVRLQGSLSSMQKQQQYLSATLPSGGGGLTAQLLGG